MHIIALILHNASLLIKQKFCRKADKFHLGVKVVVKHEMECNWLIDGLRVPFIPETIIETFSLLEHDAIISGRNAFKMTDLI